VYKPIKSFRQYLVQIITNGTYPAQDPTNPAYKISFVRPIVKGIFSKAHANVIVIMKVAKGNATFSYYSITSGSLENNYAKYPGKQYTPVASNTVSSKIVIKEACTTNLDRASSPEPRA